MVKSVGIIGFGRFGQLAAKHLKDHFQVFVIDIIDKRKKAEILLEAYQLLDDRKKKTQKANDLHIKRIEEIRLLLKRKEWLI